MAAKAILDLGAEKVAWLTFSPFSSAARLCSLAVWHSGQSNSTSSGCSLPTGGKHMIDEDALAPKRQVP
jgi:hypothetical protein